MQTQTYIPQTQRIVKMPPLEVWNPVSYDRQVNQEYATLMQQKLYMRGPGERVNKAIDDVAETALGVVIAFYIGGGSND